MNRTATFLIVSLLLASAHAQTGPTVISAAYTLPSSSVAPGQIARLHVTGLRTVLQPPVDGFRRLVKAASVPLPTSLAGISVTVRSYSRQFLHDPYVLQGQFKAPFVSIEQRNLCDDPDPGCLLTILTVQIPFEVGWPSGNNFMTDMVITENGVDSRPHSLTVGGDKIHIVGGADDVNGYFVGAIVTHADGTLVSSGSPPKPGEVIIIYAWGLGNTSPSIKTGDVTPAPAPIMAHEGRTGAFVRFDFSPNAAPSPLYQTPQAVAPAYLTPGQVGLYQVHVQLSFNLSTAGSMRTQCRSECRVESDDHFV